MFVSTFARAYHQSSTDRLRSQLVRSGVDEGEVVRMERTELKDTAAQMEVVRQA